MGNCNSRRTSFENGGGRQRIKSQPLSNTITESKRPHSHRVYLESEIECKVTGVVHSFVIDDDEHGMAMSYSLMSVLSGDVTQELFIHFLKTEYTAGQLKFFKDIDRLRDISNVDLALLSETLAKSYHSTTRIRSNNEAKDYLSQNIAILKECVSNDALNDQFIGRVKQSLNEAIIVMAMSAFPQFIRSPYYNKNSKVQATRRKSFLYGQHVMSSSSSMDLTEKAILSLDINQAVHILGQDTWMNSLFKSLDNICFSVTLSEVIDGREFPLVYVNHAFEIMTGYDCSEIIGGSCMFLQNGVSERDSISRLAVALRKAKSCRVAITNFHRNGKPFKNLLAIKPLFDLAGVYRYVVGVQINVSNPMVCASELVMVDNFLAMFPNTVFR